MADRTNTPADRTNPPAGHVSRRAGLPPVPGPLRSEPQPGLPRVAQPVRHSTPIPPLPGRRPPAGPGGRPGSGTRRRTRPPAGPARRRLVRSALAVLLVVGLIALYHLGLYFYVDHGLHRVDALATDGAEVLAPQLQDGTQNYLVVGTGVPGEKGPAAVATLLVSLSADDQRAVLLSVPPTALVDTPECRTEGGRLRQPTSEAFADSLLRGGPSCMVRAVQQLSGLRVDHFLDVDLARLPGMIDTLGGVPVCVVPSAARQAAATPLPEGPSRMSGRAATGYLAPRDAKDDATGTAVAERAQLLLTSTLRAAMSWHTLANTVTLTRFLTRASGALTIDQQTTLGDLRSLAGSLGSLSGGAVQRAGLPVAEVGYVPAGSHQSYVLLDHAATRTLFDTVIAHTRLPGGTATSIADGSADGSAAAPQGAGDAAPSPSPSPSQTSAAQPLTVAPGQVTLDVLNGTGQTGLAGNVAGLLRAQGFTVGQVGNAPGPVTGTVVRYGPGAAGQARTVAAAVPGATLQASDSIGNAVQLVLGPGYSTVVPVPVPAPAAATAVSTTAAASSPATKAPVPVAC